MNLVDRDLTEHQITRHYIVTTGRTTGADKGIRLFTHTQQVDWSRQGESDCLIKQGILRLLSSVQCSSIRANLWSDVIEWMRYEYSLVEKHAQTMLQLVKFGIDWKCGELEQIVNIPVTQIVEEITEVNIPVPQIVAEIAEVNIPVTQMVEEITEVNIPVTQIVAEITEVNIPVTQIVEEITEVNIPVTQIVAEITEVNIPVPQIVAEIAEVSKSSIEWRNIPSVSWMSLCETGQLI